VLYISTLVFRIIAKSTTARILTLDDDFFIEYGDKDRLEGLKESIDEAVDFEIRYGIPTCDYKKFQMPEEESKKKKPKDYLKICMHRAKILNRMNKISRDHYLNLINFSLNKA